MTLACKPGALLIAEIDLQTHTRWISTPPLANTERYDSLRATSETHTAAQEADHA